jgi:hypothetical protein
MTREQFERAVERLGRLLSEVGWEPEQVEDGVFNFDLGPPHVPISTGLAAIIEASGQFVLYLNFGFELTPEKCDEALRVIARANWDLLIGNFELDLDDGHLRFKASLDFSGAELDECLIRNAVLGAIRAVDKYAPDLMKVAQS